MAETEQLEWEEFLRIESLDSMLVPFGKRLFRAKYKLKFLWDRDEQSRYSIDTD